MCVGHLHQIFSLCSYKCLLSGLWYHCWHCFGSPCRPHCGPVLCFGLLLLLLCLAPTEGCLQEEEGRCQVHYQRPFPGSSSSALESDEPKGLCYICYYSFNITQRIRLCADKYNTLLHRAYDIVYSMCALVALCCQSH